MADSRELIQSFNYSPSFEQWTDAELGEQDRLHVFQAMAAAYDAGVYAIMRHHSGDPLAQDLPVGAAIVDGATGDIYQAIAQDRELGDEAAHAEIMALSYAKEHIEDMGQATIAITHEPCANCLPKCLAAGVGRLVYGAARTKIADMGLLRPRDDTAHDHLAALHTENKAPFDLFQYPDPAVQAACEELYMPMWRNWQTGEVGMSGPQSHQGTRYDLFNQDMVNARRLYSIDTVQISHYREIDLITKHFATTLEHFYKPIVP